MNSHACMHCGESCNGTINDNGHFFCCDGCKQVYLILQEKDACNPSMMKTLDGIQPKGKFKSDKWDFLDEPAIARQLISFSDPKQVHILVSIPNIHCSSCIWLIEHLGRINKGVMSATVDFEKKEALIVYDPSMLKLSNIAALLDYIGYPPSFNQASADKEKPSSNNRQTLMRIGVAGFCFSNIMMLSFPDYLANEGIDETLLSTTFSHISLLLSVPVLFYAAAPFFIQAWKGLRQQFLNIDTPIALAILITFARSVYEILGNTGTGYLDSMSGIVFFMLLGRWFQERTQKSIAFDRDYRSYFPMGALVLNKGIKKYKSIEKIIKGDLLLIRNQELIPADAILQKGIANIDYSFVTGENEPVSVHAGETIFAGGKQLGTAIEIEVTKPVAASHLTRLWNNDAFHHTKNKEASFIHPWSNYFSIALFSIAIIAGIYWQATNSANTWKAVTSILIVACPCSLLLSATFTFGNLMRIFGKRGFFLKNANVIERIAEADVVVFDKTGTLTASSAAADRHSIQYEGKLISFMEATMIKSVVMQSNHPLSRSLSEWNDWDNIAEEPQITAYEERPGQGIAAVCEGQQIRLGKSSFVCENRWFSEAIAEEGSTIHLSINGLYKGKFRIVKDYRKGVFDMMRSLKHAGKEVHIMSGDNAHEEQFLHTQLGNTATMFFNQSPEDKLQYIKSLQEKGKKLIMVGDGLNDAGALQQSNTGIAVTDNSNYFTPACDAILEGKNMAQLHQLIRITSTGKKIVAASFGLSIAYNAAGMYFATQALLSPMIAAILMPASTISIILLAYLSTRITSKSIGLPIM
jgi:Cu+-exporting ATPase